MPLDHRIVVRLLERIGNKVAIHVSPHLTRHSGTNHCAVSDMLAFLVHRLRGHSTAQMKERNLHLVENEKLGVVFRKFNPADLMRLWPRRPTY